MSNLGPFSRTLLLTRVVKELFRYDLIMAIVGFRGVRRPMAIPERHSPSGKPDLESKICEALAYVIPFYWKPVKCLQRSVVTARVLRAYGIDADVVIGYRFGPFLSHAWVEIAGRIVNDSPVFQQRLQILERI